MSSRHGSVNMNGTCRMTTNEILRSAIHEWMQKAVSAAANADLHDVHIDQLDVRFRNRKAWVEGGLQCLAIASSLVQAREWPIQVALAVSLRPRRKTHRSPPSTLVEIERAVDWAPPSLFISSGKTAPWTESVCTALGIEEIKTVNVHYCQWFYSDDAEFRSSCWFVPRRGESEQRMNEEIDRVRAR